MKVKGILFTIASALLFGFTPALASITYEMGSNAETLTFYRNLMVIPVTLLVLLFRKTALRVTPKQLFNIILVGIFGCGITTFTLYASYQYVGIGIATTLHFLYPVFVALICRIFYKEKISRSKIIALSAASLGILFFLEKSRSIAFAGIALAVFSSLTYAFYMVGLDKRGLKDMDPFKLSFYMAIAVSVGMFLYDLPLYKIVFALPPAALGITFVIALCTSFLAVIFLQRGIKYLSATTAAIFGLFEPIASSLCGVFFLGETLSPMKVIGSVVILAAAGYLSAFSQEPHPKSS